MNWIEFQIVGDKNKSLQVRSATPTACGMEGAGRGGVEWWQNDEIEKQHELTQGCGGGKGARGKGRSRGGRGVLAMYTMCVILGVALVGPSHEARRCAICKCCSIAPRFKSFKVPQSDSHTDLYTASASPTQTSRCYQFLCAFYRCPF